MLGPARHAPECEDVHERNLAFQVVAGQSQRPPLDRRQLEQRRRLAEQRPRQHVIDPFLGSGSTLIAAENTGRVCRGVELDPLYVDVIIRRYEAATGKAAVLVETGETFGGVAARRAADVREGSRDEEGSGVPPSPG